MENEARLKSLAKLAEANDRCNWVIQNDTYGGLKADLPYSKGDIEELKEAKERIKFVSAKLANPYPPDTTPPAMHVCKHPLPEVGKAAGWSAFGYEGLTHYDVEDFLTLALWDEASDLLAKNSINLHRFFAFCTGDDYIKTCAQVFPLYADGYDMTEIDDDYVSMVQPRLDCLTDRKISAMVCMGSGVKGVAGRWDQNPMNGKNNSNGTTEDHARFYDDDQMRKMFKVYLRNYHSIFDNPYLIYEPMNEPNCPAGRLASWNWEMVAVLHDELKVPYNRIAINVFDSRKVYDFLKKGINVSAHGVNSEKTVKRFLTSKERKPLIASPTFWLSGDGGDEFDAASGFVGLFHNKKYQHAAARQARNMLRMILKAGGAGIEFMPALAFIDGVVPNLQRIIDHGEAGFIKAELEQVGRKLGIDVMKTDAEGNYLNEWGELREIRAAFVNNI